jgi:hypothetical protein
MRLINHANEGWGPCHGQGGLKNCQFTMNPTTLTFNLHCRTIASMVVDSGDILALRRHPVSHVRYLQCSGVCRHHHHLIARGTSKMVRIKLETLGEGLKSLDSGLTSLGRGALNVGELAGNAAAV